MEELPTGTVTFLFTDIEGGTRLWEEKPEAMHRTLAEHDALLRAAIEQNHGSVFKTVGDAFFAVFARPEDAVQAAVDAQWALRKQLPQMRVRMAVHTGLSQAREGDYFGPALNRVARLLAAGHGGQVLLSQATGKLLRFTSSGETRLRPLGMHRLRDIAGRETIYQLLPSGLPSDFPPLNTLDVAFRRGVLRTTAVGAVILLVIGALALGALQLAGERKKALAESRRLLYAAQMNLAQQAWDQHDVERARDLVEAQRPGRGEEDQRGFEWRRLWLLCRQAGDRFILPGHTDTVRAVAFSPDGRLLASASRDKTIRLWDVRTRRVVAILPGHRNSFNSVAFSPDGRLLASADEGPDGWLPGAVHLWDLATRREVALFRRDRCWVNTVAFSPDGRLLAAGGFDSPTSRLDNRTLRLIHNTVRLWDLRSRRVVAFYRGSKQWEWVTAAAFSSDGRLLALGSEDASGGVVGLWDLAGKRQPDVLGRQTRGVPAIAFSHDGKTLAVGRGDTGIIARRGDDNSVTLWDVARKVKLAVLGGHTGQVPTVAFSPDDMTLATGSGDGTIKLWDIAARHEITSLRGHKGWVDAVAFSPDGKTLASGSGDTTVRLWSASPKPDAEILLGHTDGVWSLAISLDGKTLASGSRDRTVKLWDAATRRQVASLRTGHPYLVSSLAFSPDGRIMASSGPAWLPADWSVKLWDVEARRQLAILRGHKGWIQGVAFSPDGKTLASGSGDGTVKLWDIASRRNVASLTGPWTGVDAVAFSPDGKWLVVGATDPTRGFTASLWDFATRKEVTTFVGHTQRVRSVAFSPDGRILATASEDATVRLWDVATRRGIGLLQGHAFQVSGAAFSPDGKTLATSSEDNTVKLWSVAMKEEVGTLKGHTAPVMAVAFTPDGKTLVTASLDKTVRLWRAANFAETDAPAGIQRTTP